MNGLLFFFFHRSPTAIYDLLWVFSYNVCVRLLFPSSQYLNGPSVSCAEIHVELGASRRGAQGEWAVLGPTCYFHNIFRKAVQNAHIVSLNLCRDWEQKVRVYAISFPENGSYDLPQPLPGQENSWSDIMIYFLTAIGLSPGGSSTVHIYT